MDKVNTFGKMVIYTLENGNQTDKMDGDKWFIQPVIIIKEYGKTAKSMVMEF